MKKINLKKEKETLFITLYAKALESRLPNSLLKDSKANLIVKQTHFDFSKFGIGEVEARAIAIRALQFDKWTKDFIKRNNQSVIIQLGCGLDSRVVRLKPPSTVLWYDVDYPDVINLRKKYFGNKRNYKMLGKSVTSVSLFKSIPKNRHTLIICEGLLMYLEKEDVKNLLHKVPEYFNHGEMICDSISALGIKMNKKNPAVKISGARFKWSIENPNEIINYNPKYTLTEQLTSADLPGMEVLPNKYKLLIKIFNIIPAIKHAGLLLRYKF